MEKQEIDLKNINSKLSTTAYIIIIYEVITYMVYYQFLDGLLQCKTFSCFKSSGGCQN